MPDRLLRLWITLAKHAIAFMDDATIRLKRIPTNEPHPHIQSLSIPTHHGTLDARLCLPPSPKATILICHGIGDRLSYWQQAQLLLHTHHIASLIFDYSSYGVSTGNLSLEILRQNTLSAYAALPPNIPRFVLGFSMGTGIAADATSHLSPAPSGLILCQPFRSMRSAATELVRLKHLARLMPDIWRTADIIAHLTVPVLIVHSDADRLFPLHHAQAIHANAPHSRLAVPTGFPHPGIYLTPTLAYWQPILDFITDFVTDSITNNIV